MVKESQANNKKQSVTSSPKKQRKTSPQQQQQQKEQQPTGQQGQQQNKLVVVDAANCISGRLCSKVSKLLLQGNRVSVVNAEKVMVSGNKYEIIESYKKRLEVGSVINPIHGPFHPRRPDTIITKMIRGMVPKRKPSGIHAFKKLRVYIGVPDELKNSAMQTFDDAKITRPESFYTSMSDVAKQIGWKGVVQ
ncbi:MAG: 50S ribosomal protein L13 [Candidatus Nitrosocosmicus sp.]|uniref:50S ribosomal protein L13 n=1 Tax=Candidatus Nitrosocosmicus sp. FF01 TaxID=3397670 RepID=UPI002A6D6F8D|nr:50S ribosomal protein L13 [Candidatus Nitrosocosmicus sp.]